MSLAALLEQSQRLAQLEHGSSSHELPAIQLGLDQIERQSRRIAAKANTFPGGSATAGSGDAAFLLAQAGVNASELGREVRDIDLTGTFEPLVPLSETDVDGFLRHTHEQTIISTIEEGRRATQNDFYQRLDAKMRRDWNKQKERLFDELGRHQPSTSQVSSATTTTRKRGALPEQQQQQVTGSLQMHAKMMRYDTVVHRLNDYRRQGYAFALSSALTEASAATGSTSSTQQQQESKSSTDTWRLLTSIVGERDVLNGEFQRAALAERHYASAYLSAPSSAPKMELNTKIARGSREHLERQYMEHVERTVAQRPLEAQLGGDPSVQNKIRAFLNVKYKQNGQWSNQALEIVDDVPMWAKTYHLLRAGKAQEALQFAQDHEAAFARLEKGFVPYFKAWLDSPERRLPKALRDRFLTEFNQRIRYSSSSTDPYKFALYKLIGRLELNRKNVPGVTLKTEDWLWFQLSLVRESVDDPAHEEYGLDELARVLVGFGERHFDPKGNKPMLYTQILLLCGQFERAVAFLYAHSAYQADAVHFAIALTYYGLLRPGPSSSASAGSSAGAATGKSSSVTPDAELLAVETDASGHETACTFNFARMLYRYTRLFALSDAQEAAQYLYLLCLNADVPTIGKAQVDLCHEYIRELVMQTRQYAELLGDVRADGTKIPGMLERDVKLMRLPDSQAYLTSIVRSAARRADHEKRFSEAVLLYNLAEEYDSVVQVLNVELGNSLARPSLAQQQQQQAEMQYFKDGTIGMVASGTEDVVAVAQSILEHYDRSVGISSRVSRKNRDTCEKLMRLKRAITDFETFSSSSTRTPSQGQAEPTNDTALLERALETIEAVNVVPLHGDLVAIVRAVEDFKDLSESIVKNFDIVLLTTMNILYKLHQDLKDSPFGDASRQQRMLELRAKARSLMTFAGMLRFRLTSDTYAALARLDVFIH